MTEIENLLARAILAAEEKDWIRCAQLVLGAQKLIEEKEELVCTHASGQEPWREVCDE